MKPSDPGESPWHWLLHKAGRKFHMFLAVAMTASTVLLLEAMATGVYSGFFLWMIISMGLCGAGCSRGWFD